MIRVLMAIGLMVAMMAPVHVRAAEGETPARAEHASQLAIQFQRLLTANKRANAIMAEQEIWRLWFIGETEAETERLAEASMVMQQGGLAEAVALLVDLTGEFPMFAEARNQLAFARFLLGDLQGSLDDIEKVLALEPRHFGALAGRARIEATLGQLEAAQLTMGQVGAIHPWMARLSPIRPNPPPPPPPEVREL
ncbi:MAG: hypothetical protein ACPGVA_08705 [Pikeienuella sp.]